MERESDRRHHGEHGTAEQKPGRRAINLGGIERLHVGDAWPDRPQTDNIGYSGTQRRALPKCIRPRKPGACRATREPAPARRPYQRMSGDSAVSMQVSSSFSSNGLIR